MIDRRRLLCAGALAAGAVLTGCDRQGRDAGSATAPRSRPRDADRKPGEDATDGARSESGVSDAGREEAAGDTPGSGDGRDPANASGEESEAGGSGDETSVAVEVICRDALGLTVAAAHEREHRLQRVTLHHTAVELEANRLAPERLRGHQRHHLGAGWADVAYHYAVDLRGNVYELRDVTAPGDTFTDYDPTGHLLVVCEGNYDEQEPGEAMLGGVADLLAHAADEHGLSPETLRGHRDHAPGTRCPGEGLQSRISELREEAARRRRAAPRHLTSVCGQDGRDRVAAIAAGA